MAGHGHSSSRRPASAEDWFARLSSDDCTALDRIAFEQWRKARPDNDAAYREVERLWHRSGALHRFADIQQAMDMPVTERRRNWKLPLAAAAVLVLAVGLGLTQFWDPGRGERVMTATGEQRAIMLADGSSVLLDAESELRIRYGEHERKLVLVAGQAQFTVERDAERPFVVQAASGSVTALGTVFQVRVDGSLVNVTLLEGKVAVSEKGGAGRLQALMPGSREAAPADGGEGAGSAVLAPGEQIRFDRRREVWNKRPADLDVALGWTQGDIVFKEWRLADLVAEMNRHSATKVRIRDDSIADLRISGRFHAGDQQAMIRVLEGGWPVRARSVSDAEIALSSQ